MVADQGCCARATPRVRATYWSVLGLTIAFGALRLSLLGNALEGIALLLCGLPGAAALAGIRAATMRVWHLGASACWTAYCAFCIAHLVHHPVSPNWVIYVGSGTCAVLALALSGILHIATSPELSKWRDRKAGGNGPLLPQTMREVLNEDAAVQPLVWPPPAHPLNAQPTDSGSGFDQSGDSGFASSAMSAPSPNVWPPPGYTGN
jgi:hypothetical protein